MQTFVYVYLIVSAALIVTIGIVHGRASRRAQARQRARIREAKQRVEKFTSTSWSAIMAAIKEERELCARFKKAHVVGDWSDKWDSKLNEEVHQRLQEEVWRSEVNLNARLSELGVDEPSGWEQDGWEYQQWYNATVGQLKARYQ